ncbi:MAG: single-stranded DNA-binding protein [Burkholderia sp.]|nr:single-stranded DNA-binding protein [Burkholderia sp.]
MASINKVILIGNLGADPDIRYLQSGSPVANIRLATTDRYKDKSSGDFKEITEWHRITFFGRLAEIVKDYLKKGSSIYLEGRIRTRKWQGQDGQDRYLTEIIADQMQMLSGRNNTVNTLGNAVDHTNYTSNGEVDSRSSVTQNARSSVTPACTPGGFDTMDDDIPF